MQFLLCLKSIDEQKINYVTKHSTIQSIVIFSNQKKSIYSDKKKNNHWLRMVIIHHKTN